MPEPPLTDRIPAFWWCQRPYHTGIVKSVWVLQHCIMPSSQVLNVSHWIKCLVMTEFHLGYLHVGSYLPLPWNFSLLQDSSRPSLHWKICWAAALFHQRLQKWLFLLYNIVLSCLCPFFLKQYVTPSLVIDLTALGNAAHSICRMISCIRHSPIKHSLIIFAYCVKLRVISVKIPGTRSFQNYRSHLRTESQHTNAIAIAIAFSLFLCWPVVSLVHCTSVQLKADSGNVIWTVNSQKTEDFFHHSNLLFEWHFASMGERILPFLKPISYFHAVSMAELAIWDV